MSIASAQNQLNMARKNHKRWRKYFTSLYVVAFITKLELKNEGELHSEILRFNSSTIKLIKYLRQ